MIPAVSILVLLAAPCVAQSPEAAYPDRPIRIVSASPAGGGVDLSARIVAASLQALWGVSVTVENRTGGSNNIAGEAVARAEPDGYTLLATPPNTLTANAVLFRRLAYDPAALAPVAVMAVSANVLAVRVTLPAKSVVQLIRLARETPLSYASQGNGSTAHLTAELFKSRTGIAIGHVPYRGAAPAANDLAGGHVDVMFCDLGTIWPLYVGGKVDIIAVSTLARLPQLPAVPTIDESGVPGFSSTTFYALMAPPGTPAGIRAKLNRAIVAAMQTPEVAAKLAAILVEASPLDPAAMGAFITDEARRWGEVIRTAHISIEP